MNNNRFMLSEGKTDTDFRGHRKSPCYLLQFSSKHGAAHSYNKYHILLNWREASGGKVVNKIATIDLDKEKGAKKKGESQ